MLGRIKVLLLLQEVKSILVGRKMTYKATNMFENTQSSTTEEKARVKK